MVKSIHLYTKQANKTFVGKVKDSASRPTTPDTTDGVVVVQAHSNLIQPKAKRENAAALLWKTAARRMSAKVHFDESVNYRSVC